MSKKSSDGNDGLTPEQIAMFKNVVRDPVLFASHVLGLDLWPREAEILRSIKAQRRTAIKACHGVGKTFTLAVVALWWLARYREGIVLTTSSTQRQVRTQLWLEIHRLVKGAKVPYPELKSTEIKFRGDNNFAIGFSTNHSENFQGYHGKYVLIIADEAPGIESGIWDAVAGTMAGGVVHIVMAGNPTVPSGAFYDAFTKERGLWNCFTISVFDSPNLKGITLEQLLEMDPAEGGQLDQNPIPYLATKRWVYDQRQTWWHGDESSSPHWMSRVLAEFPSQAEDALFKMIWLERARQRAIQTPSNGSPTNLPLFAGVDVGGGTAETVIYVCEFREGRLGIVAKGAWRGQDTRGQAVRFLSQFRSRLCLVNVDAIGIGYNFALHLQSERFPVAMVNVSLPCESKPNLRENDPAKRFVNLKAYAYQRLADLFERNQVDGLTDEETIGQLAGIRWELDSHGRIKIESKEQARGRGEPSPDRAEALMLAVCKPPREYGYIPAPQQPRPTDPSEGGPELADFLSDFPSRRDRGRLFEDLRQGALGRSLRRHRGAW
jgi:phage terminase large subunit